MSELQWRLGETTWADLPHVTDNYVVHARGFVVGDEIWFNPLALFGGHRRFWNEYLADEYDTDTWDDFDRQTLYFSITGAPVFTIQHPSPDEVTPEAVGRLDALLAELAVPDDAHVHWKTDTGTEQLTRADIAEMAAELA